MADFKARNADWIEKLEFLTNIISPMNDLNTRC